MQEPCEDEYVKVPKKALKYRTAGMVAYNAEWLKNNFDIERAVICGAQEPCEDAISRQAVIDINENHHGQMPNHINHQIWQEIKDLPSVTPQPKIGQWIKEKSIRGWDGHSYQCSVCGRSIHLDTEVEDLEGYPYCHCGAKMIENEEEFDNLEEMLEKLWNATESEVEE